MSDAREIVQPRWKRRATEIAEAIGGNSGGVSSVSLDSNTITELSQAIADAIDLKVLDINIKQYDDGLVSSSGLPIRTGTGPVSGGFLPLRVVTDIGDKVDINVKQYNDVSVDTRGLPVQAGRTTTTNTLVPLVVNCPTTNNFPTGGSLSGTVDVNIKEYDGTAVNTTGLPFKQGWAAGTNSREVIMVAEQNTVNVDLSGALGFNSLTALPVTVSGTVATTETAPVTTVSVDNHPTSTTVTGTVSVTETNPVSGGGGGGAGGLNITDTTTAFKNALYGVGVTANTTVHEQVETAMDSALANATGISVTESAPVTTVKITGDETYGIIMSKNFYDAYNASPNINYLVDRDYNCAAYGLAVNVTTQDTIQGYNTAGGPYNPYSDGWTIRVNGVDIPNQDISLHLRGKTPTPSTTAYTGANKIGQMAADFPLFIGIDSQATLDKYHGRKVTLSSVANVWIVEPVTIDSNTFGTVINVSGSGTVTWTVRTDDGNIHYLQSIWDDGADVSNSSANKSKYIGARVTRGTVSTLWIVRGTDLN